MKTRARIDLARIYFSGEGRGYFRGTVLSAQNYGELPRRVGAVFANLSIQRKNGSNYVTEALDAFRATHDRAISANVSLARGTVLFSRGWEGCGGDSGCNMLRPTVIVCSCRASSYRLQAP